MFKKAVRIIAALSAFICLFSLSLTASAASQVPYQSYTYWENIGEERKAVYSRPMYENNTVIDARALGVAPFTQINDVVCGEDEIYILDNAARIVALDKNYKFLREITELKDKTGAVYDFTGAQFVRLLG